MALFLRNFKFVRVFGLAFVVVAAYVYCIAISDYIRYRWKQSDGVTGISPMKRERELDFRKQAEEDKDISVQPSIRHVTQELHHPDYQPISPEDKHVSHHPDDQPTTEVEALVDEQADDGDGADISTHIWTTSTSLDTDDSVDSSNGSDDSKLQMNRLNYDVWWRIVGFTVDDLRIVNSYPNLPDERKTINELHVEFNESDPDDLKGKYGHKIYGYLFPPLPGEYRFSIEMSDVTAAGCVELWLSTDNNPLNMNKILVLEHSDLARQTSQNTTFKMNVSEPIRMDSRAHYFEFIEKAFDGNMVVDITWKPPHMNDFVEIEAGSFAMAAKFDSNGQFTGGQALEFLGGPLPSNKLQSHDHVHYVGDVLHHMNITDLPVLPDCKFNAAYAMIHKVKELQGGKEVKESRVYPDDKTTPKNCTVTGWKSHGNPLISRNVLQKVFTLYSKAFTSVHKGRVLKINHLEETVNKAITPVFVNSKLKRKRRKKVWPVYGSRFLLEATVQLDTPVPHQVLTSEYVYLPKDSDNLCHTENFQWKRQNTAFVYLVVALKDLGFWVEHLIQNMEDIYAKTGDDNFELVIVDYESEDIDIEEKLKASSVNRWHFIRKNGNFSRSAGLQAGIDYVTDPNSIVMTIDMHLTLPPGFVEYVRRHTIQGKMACAPFFLRLNKGYTEVNINGHWEVYTYGLISMFKSDWNSTGGFDLIRYTTTWGGEDWDMVDKIVGKGYEIFRIRYPGLVHYYHTKAGMWGVDGAKKRPI